MVFDVHRLLLARPGPLIERPGRWTLLPLCLALLAPLAAGADPIRSAYFYSYMSPEHLDSLAAAGFNQAVTKCIQDSLGTRGATELTRYLARAPGLGIEVVPEWSLQSRARLDSLPTTRRYTWGTMVEANVGCPIDSVFWRSTLRDRAVEVLDAFPEVHRLVVDLEIYTGSCHHYDKGPCRCPGCLAEFAARGPEASSDLETFEEERITGILEALLRDLMTIRPELAVGFFDLDYNSFIHRAMVRALVRTGLPTANYTERTYTRGASAIPEARAPLDSLGLAAPLLCGLKLSSFAPAALTDAARTLLRTDQSYFIFTSYSLWQDPAKLVFPYLLAGTQAEYWAALRAANLAPRAVIAQPGAGTVVRMGDNVNLSGSATDPYDAAPNLNYHWEASLLKNGAIVGSATVDGATGTFAAGTSGDGAGLSYGIRLIVTNSSGFKDTASCSLPVLDGTPPALTSGPTVTAAKDTAKVQWALSEAGIGSVSFGFTTALGASVATPLSTTHVAILRGLARGTKYYYRVAAADAAGNTVLTTIRNFTTPSNRKPLAVAAGTPLKGLAPLTVVFSSAGSSDPDADPLSCSWNFGDGTSATGPSATHRYANAGTFVATLTVTDGFGGSATSKVNVTAYAFPYAPTLDNFNRSNGSLRGSWTGTTSALAIKTNALVQSSSGTPVALWNGAVYGPAQEAFVTLSSITSSSTDHDLLLKCQGTSYTAGAIEVRYDAKAKAIYVATYTAGTAWVTRGTISQTLTAGNQLGARAFADGSVEVYRNGVKLGTVSVSAWPHAAKGGRIGLLLKNATSSRLDNFGGGNIPVATGASSFASSSDASHPGEDHDLPEVDDPLVASDAVTGLPRRVELSHAFPNPSAHGVTFALALPRDARVSWRICDVQGRNVWSESREFEAGRTALAWHGRSAGGEVIEPGVYFADFQVGAARFARRVVVTR